MQSILVLAFTADILPFALEQASLPNVPNLLAYHCLDNYNIYVVSNYFHFNLGRTFDTRTCIIYILDNEHNLYIRLHSNLTLQGSLKHIFFS